MYFGIYLGVRELDLAWFEVVFVGYKFLSSENEPYWLVIVRADIWRGSVDS